MTGSSSNATEFNEQHWREAGGISEFNEAEWLEKGSKVFSQAGPSATPKEAIGDSFLSKKRGEIVCAGKGEWVSAEF